MTKLIHLYASFQPSNYNLSLDLQRLVREFSGKVIITGELTELNAPIKLHAKGLKITGALMGDIPVDTKIGKNDELILTPTSSPIDKNIVLTLTFSGKITDSMHGLYPCYFEHDGINKELLMTQFEPFHAHEVFPCIDEPEAKATFDLTLHTEDNIEVLSNMPVVSQEKDDNQLITTFATTPKMSTYLLAVVAGELHKISGKTKDGIEVNAWATPAQSAKSLSFALDVAIRSIEFFSDYFGTPYPLPKTDHVAVPDFSSAAMENWGLITYRESYFLVDESSAVSTKQATSECIAHEVSHQWFGNLVTMCWWDDLWLNESFANMMAYIAVDALFPKWKIWNEFASHESIAALRRDSLPGVQPVKIAVNHPDEIGTIFDPSIVYAKGGNLLNMLRRYIGDKAFSDGLKSYFKKHAYSNTTGNDLWKELTKSSGQDIGVFMTQWLEKSGFPVVDIKLDSGKIKLSQHHFLIGIKGDDRLWPIPLFGSSDTVPKLLTKRSTNLPSTDEIILLNKNDMSYFITQYDSTLQKRLMKSMDKLSDIDRLKLLSDASLLSRGLLKPAADLIDLLLAFRQENTQPVWSLMSLIVADLRRFTDNNEHSEAQLKKLVRQLGEKLYQQLGWQEKQGEDEQITKLRSIIIGLMIYAENPKAISTALEKYDSAKGDLTKLDGELRISILIANVRHSNPAIVDELLNYHKTTSSSDLKQDICAALTGTRDIKVGKRLLTLLTDNALIRPQDVPTWFAYMIRNRYLREITWQWLTSNWDWVENTFKDDHHYDIFALYAANTFASRDYKQNFRKFFTPKLNEIALRRTIEIGLDEIAGRVRWIEHNQAAVSKRLEELQ